MNKKQFLDWLIGFTEGDGSWFIRKNHTVGFELSQHSCDASLLYKIKKYLGYGSVIHNSKISISRYCLTKNQYQDIINKFNFRIKSNYRFYQFYSWCRFIHSNIDNTIDINSISKDNNPINFDNAWLSGFIDAEGCFRIAIDKTRPKLIFEISQKEIEILQDIANILSLKKNIRKDRNTYVLYTSDYKARIKLINYLDKYPLKTKKLISYINWKKAHNLDIQDPNYKDKILKFKLNIHNNVKNI